VNEEKKKEEKKVEEKEEEVLSPLEKIQQAVDAKKKKEAGSITGLLDLPAKEEIEEEKKEEEKKEEKKEEEEKEEEKKEETEEEEKEEKEEEEVEDKLVAEIARVSALAAGHETEIQGGPKEEKEEEKKEEKKGDPPAFLAPVEVKDIVYIEKDTMGETFDEKDVTSMNKVLNKVVTEANRRGRTQAFQDVLKIVPQIIDQRVKGHLAAMEFWRKNPGLEKLSIKHPGLKDFVAIKTNEIQTKNPKFTLGQVYNQVDQEVQAILGDRIKETKEEQADSEEKKKVVRIPRKPGASRTIPIKTEKKTKQSSQQDQMSDLSRYRRGE